MRDRETIDSELRRIALGRRSIDERGGRPSMREVDELLDERLGHRPEPSETEAVTARDESKNTIRPHRRRSALIRFGPLAALPLSLLAVAAVFVVMFAGRSPEPAAQPEAAPPPPSSSARPVPAPPVAPAPMLDIPDRALIGALKQNGVPVPSNEYVTSHGHAVCDFLAQQPDFAEAIRFVQRSSIWDANQSANFTAGAVVSYCPQYQPTSAAEVQPGLQNALSDMQRIEGELHGIQGDLQGITDGLPPIPGHQ